MWDWIKSNKTIYGFTDCYFIEKGLEEYKRMYGRDVLDDMISSGIKHDNISERMREYNQEIKISTHFSDSHFNPTSIVGYVDGFIGYSRDKEEKRNTNLMGKYCKEYELKLDKFETFLNKKK
jgi:hypothetical protein